MSEFCNGSGLKLEDLRCKSWHRIGNKIRFTASCDDARGEDVGAVALRVLGELGLLGGDGGGEAEEGVHYCSVCRVEWKCELGLQRSGEGCR